MENIYLCSMEMIFLSNKVKFLNDKSNFENKKLFSTRIIIIIKNLLEKTIGILEKDYFVGLFFPQQVV